MPPPPPHTHTHTHTAYTRTHAHRHPHTSTHTHTHTHTHTYTRGNVAFCMLWDFHTHALSVVIHCTIYYCVWFHVRSLVSLSLGNVYIWLPWWYSHFVFSCFYLVCFSCLVCHLVNVEAILMSFPVHDEAVAHARAHVCVCVCLCV